MPRRKRAEDGEGAATPKKKAKATVNLTKQQFVECAGDLPGKIGSNEFVLRPKVLGTGSVGWSLSQKMPIEWKKSFLLTQVSLNCTAIGSKDWSTGDDETKEPLQQEAPKMEESECKVPEGMNKAAFMEHATTIPLVLGVLDSVLKPKQYESGNCGWFFSGRLKPTIEGESVQCMVTVNATVVNSGQWPLEGDIKENEDEEAEEEGEEDGEEEGDEDDDEDDDGDASGADEAAPAAKADDAAAVADGAESSESVEATEKPDAGEGDHESGQEESAESSGEE